jgi:Ca-activated chloride channel family protein
MKRIRVEARLLACSLAAGAAVLVVPGPAQAAPDPASTLAPVMVVLDASGSMNEAIAGSGTKMAAARTAVHTLVQQAPDDARLGLTVYGAGTGNSAAEKAAGCQDVKVVHKVGALDRPALDAAVDGVQARGYTPIGQSLRVAAAELPAEGPRSIVLVSDGIDTCAPPDPCEVARELARQGTDLRIHAVGFDIDDKARQQLDCVARATGGTYVDAPDTATLTSALNRITQRALRTYEPVGTPVTGTKEPAGAPALRAGAYLDRIRSGEFRHYTVDVPAGYTLYVTATALMPPNNASFVKIQRQDGKDCSPTGSSGAVGADEPAVSASLTWQAPPEASPGTDQCERAGAQVVRVELDPVYAGRDPVDVPLEVLIGLEPPVSGDAGPAGTGDRAAFTAPTGAATAVVGGGSFSTAATLDGSGSYTDAVFNKELVFYRVRLDWGKGLAYRVRFNGRGYVATHWYSPAREQLGSDFASFENKETTLDGTSDALGGPPVLYRNRELDTKPASDVSVAGWYYIAILVDLRPETTPLTVTLDVSVTGETQPRPGYLGDAGTDPFGDQSGRSAGAAGADATEDSQSLVSAKLLWLGVPLLLLLVAGAAVTGLILIRRRRSPA